jgi:hypothetical protein
MKQSKKLLSDILQDNWEKKFVRRKYNICEYKRRIFVLKILHCKWRQKTTFNKYKCCIKVKSGLLHFYKKILILHFMQQLYSTTWKNAKNLC